MNLIEEDMNVPHRVTRVVDQAMQDAFTSLSGDSNPLHVDALAARRTAAGKPVVHGMHTLMWALEEALAAGFIERPPLRVRVKFVNWVYLGDVAELTIDRSANGGVSLEAAVAGLAVLSADVAAAAGQPETAPVRSPATPRALPASPGFAEMEGLSGDVFTADDATAIKAFPILTRALGARAAAELAACSYVVGMETPGLHSIFSKADVTIGVASSEDHSALHFEVIQTDDRFSKVRIAVAGRSVQGTLDAFMRPAPVQQASISSLSDRVAPGEFGGMHALILGGSRGLGELTAKLFAAGGGRSTITFARGRKEAEDVAAEIRAAGGLADVMQYDVLTPASAQIVGFAQPVTHLFYFATNAIFRPRGTLVTPSNLAEFLAYYVHGFYDACMHLVALNRSAGGGKLTAYYPSSIAVEERPANMTEYTMAKAAGEVMCADMNRFVPGLRVVTTRLPRLRTDQTASVVPDRDQDPIDVMLPIMRSMMKAEAD